MNAEVKLDKVSFKNYVFHGDMRIEKFKIAEVASLVEGIDEHSLEFLVNALTELILNDDMAKKLKGGASHIKMYSIHRIKVSTCRSSSTTSSSTRRSSSSTTVCVSRRISATANVARTHWQSRKTPRRTTTTWCSPNN